jgi:hypothetical protein
MDPSDSMRKVQLFRWQLVVAAFALLVGLSCTSTDQSGAERARALRGARDSRGAETAADTVAVYIALLQDTSVFVEGANTQYVRSRYVLGEDVPPVILTQFVERDPIDGICGVRIEAGVLACPPAPRGALVIGLSELAEGITPDTIRLGVNLGTVGERANAGRSYQYNLIRGSNGWIIVGRRETPFIVVVRQASPCSWPNVRCS